MPTIFDNIEQHLETGLEIHQPFHWFAEFYDEIDKALAEHYGFTEEELDFLINYDIKYRMGKELNDYDAN